MVTVGRAGRNLRIQLAAFIGQVSLAPLAFAPEWHADGVVSFAVGAETGPPLMPDGNTTWQLLLQRTGDLAPEQA